MTAVPELETERLHLRAFREDDLDAYGAIVADAEVMQFMGGPRSRARAWSDMAWCLGHWRLRGYGLWAVEAKADGALVGRIGLINPEGWLGLEAGWLLGRAHWGQGYATEGGRAALGFAFEELGVPEVISLIRPGNEASVRVAERLGARLRGQSQVDGWETLIYAVKRGPSG